MDDHLYERVGPFCGRIQTLRAFSDLSLSAVGQAAGWPVGGTAARRMAARRMGSQAAGGAAGKLSGGRLGGPMGGQQLAGRAALQRANFGCLTYVVDK